MLACARVFLLQIVVVLLTACASDARLKSDYDPDVDFSAFRTFNLIGATEIENPDFPDLLKLYYSAAIEQQMLERGYTRADDPDILIRVSVDLKNMTSAPKLAKRRTVPPYSTPATACPSSGDYHGQVARSASSAGSLSTLCRFKEGSINIEMTGVVQKRTIWTGSFLVRIDEHEWSAYLLQNIANDTALLFEDSPLVTWRELSQVIK
jgi:hypothetical protein